MDSPLDSMIDKFKASTKLYGKVHTLNMLP